jgi:hypothetical protein
VWAASQPPVTPVEVGCRLAVTRVVPRTRPNEVPAGARLRRRADLRRRTPPRSPLALGRFGLGPGSASFRRAPVTVSDPGEDGWLTVAPLEPCVDLWLTNRTTAARGGVPRVLGLTVRAHQADGDQLEAGADRTVTAARSTRGRARSRPCPASHRERPPLHLQHSGAPIVGDLVSSVPPGELSTYPGGGDRRPGGAAARGGAPARLRVRRAAAPRRPAAPFRRQAESPGIRGVERDRRTRTGTRERRTGGPSGEGEKICHNVEPDDPDRALRGKDVTGYPSKPPWPMCVVCVDP